MMTETDFRPYGGGRICPECGSLLGTYGNQEDFCPAPVCRPDGKLVPGIDPSYLYRGRALLFVPDPKAPDVEGCDQTGSIIAVRPAEVTSPVARRHAPVVARAVCWPRDRKRFGELFDHHVHHVDGPLVQPPNDGWDADHPLPVL